MAHDVDLPNLPDPGSENLTFLAVKIEAWNRGLRDTSLTLTDHTGWT
jgi:hypothetical protein